MKRVKQISLDILVDDTVDGETLAYAVADVLELKQYNVVGYGFQGDLTKVYEELYPSLVVEDGYFEAVEVCPHCDSENVYPMWDTEVSGFVAVCKTCGKEIFLCDECQHTVCEDGEPHDCDWCRTECGGKCHRGRTRD
jgi:hypothetical protein